MQYHSSTKVQTPIAKGFNNTETTSYFNIEKSASSTTTTYLKRQKNEYEFEQNIVDSGDVVISNCSFTFVRDPLQRFISAYYTVSRLMWDVEVFTLSMFLCVYIYLFCMHFEFAFDDKQNSENQAPSGPRGGS